MGRYQCHAWREVARFPRLGLFARQAVLVERHRVDSGVLGYGGGIVGAIVARVLVGRVVVGGRGYARDVIRVAGVVCVWCARARGSV